MGEWWRWALLSPDGVAPCQMVGVSASVNLPLQHKVHKFSSGTGLPGWSRKKGRKTLVCVFCTVTDFSAAEKDRREILHACLTTILTGLLPFW